MSLIGSYDFCKSLHFSISFCSLIVKGYGDKGGFWSFFAKFYGILFKFKLSGFIYKFKGNLWFMAFFPFFRGDSLLWNYFSS